MLKIELSIDIYSLAINNRLIKIIYFSQSIFKVLSQLNISTFAITLYITLKKKRFRKENYM